MIISILSEHVDDNALVITQLCQPSLHHAYATSKFGPIINYHLYTVLLVLS